MAQAQSLKNSVFYSPDVSIYKFFKLFFAALQEANNSQSSPQPVIKKEIVKQLYRAKQSGKYDQLLEEFSFFDNGIFVYSKQVEDGISQMQLSGLISKKNPRFAEIMINNELDINELKQQNKELFDKTKELVTNYALPQP